MTFAGFDPDAPRFYADLASTNTREWWQANKARYAETVRGPVEQLADVLGAEFGPVKIFRPHRDVRFSADKRPIKDHIGFVTTPADGTAHYGQLNEHGLMLAGGVYQPSRDQLRRFRALVDDNRLVGDLEAKAALGYTQVSYELGEGFDRRYAASAAVDQFFSVNVGLVLTL